MLYVIFNTQSPNSESNLMHVFYGRWRCCFFCCFKQINFEKYYCLFIKLQKIMYIFCRIVNNWLSCFLLRGHLCWQQYRYNFSLQVFYNIKGIGTDKYAENSASEIITNEDKNKDKNCGCLVKIIQLPFRKMFLWLFEWYQCIWILKIKRFSKWEWHYYTSIW